MKDQRKTKTQLIAELESARRRVAELEGEDSHTHKVLEAVIEQSPIPIVIATATGGLWRFNEACAEQMGFDDDPAIVPGTNLLDLKRSWKHYDGRGNEIAVQDLPLARAFQGEVTRDHVYRVVRQDGTERWQSASAAPIYGDDGDVVAALLMFPDITESHFANKALRDSEHRLKSLVESVRVIPWRFDLMEGRFTFMGKQVEDILGYPIASWTDLDSWSDRILAMDREAAVEYCQISTARGEDHDFEYRTETTSGEVVWIRDIVTVRRDEAGAPVELIGFMVDITESKLVEEALRDRTERYELLTAGAAMWDWDVPNKTVLFSPRWKQMRGFDPEEVGDREEEWFAHIHPDDAPRVRAAITAHCQGETNTFGEEYRVLCKDGTEKWIADHGVARLDASGNVVRMAGVEFDITERKEAEWALVESERSLKEAQAIAQVGSWSHNLETGALLWSAELFQIMGMERQDLTIDVLLDHVHDEDRADLVKVMEQEQNGVEPGPWEFRIVRPDGTVRHILNRRETERDAEGNVVRLFGTAQDITERKQAEAVLERVGHMASTSPDLIAFLCENFRYLAFNSAYGEAFELNSREVIGEKMADVLGKKYFEDVIESDARRCLAGETVEVDGWVDFPGREPMYMTAHYYPYRDSQEGGRITGFVVTARDISDRYRSRALEAGQREILELMTGDPVSQTQVLEAITQVAETHVPDVRSSILLLDGNVIRHGAAPSMPEEYNALLDGLAIGPAVGSCGTAMYLKERVIVEDVRTDVLWANYRDMGEKYAFRACWSQPILDSAGEVLGTFALYRDRPGSPSPAEIGLIESMSHLAGITIQRKTRETELRKLSAAIEQSPALVMITDRDGTIEYVNAKFSAATGYSAEEAVGNTPRMLKGAAQPESYYKELWMTVLSGKEWQGEFQNRKKNGELYWESGTISSIKDEHGEISHLLSVREEITEHKALEADKADLELHMKRAQKLETIGTLAGGIAHDFNNILTPIMGYAEIADERTQPSDPLHGELTHILIAAQRAKALVDRILLFSRQTESVRKPVKIQLIAQEALQLLRSSLPATIAIDERIDSSCAWVFADATQIHEVIVNLCTNAYHAMEGDNGTLTVAVEEVVLDVGTARMHPTLSEKDYVRLSVRDTGTGMPPDVVDRIFEPFFTTKAVGKGSGMGLSVVHGIVKSHDGDVLVDSTPGEGTVFEVYLPVTTAEVQIVPEDSKEKEKGHESILLVDDDPAIAEVVTAMLESNGYAVKTCTSSPAALEEVTQYPERYDLVLSDLTMPKLTGMDLAMRLGEFDRPVPILIMTGHGERLEHDGRDIPRVLGKPFSMKALTAAVREVLDD